MPLRSYEQKEAHSVLAEYYYIQHFEKAIHEMDEDACRDIADTLARIERNLVRYDARVNAHIKALRKEGKRTNIIETIKKQIDIFVSLTIRDLSRDVGDLPAIVHQHTMDWKRLQEKVHEISEYLQALSKLEADLNKRMLTIEEEDLGLSRTLPQTSITIAQAPGWQTLEGLWNSALVSIHRMLLGCQNRTWPVSTFQEFNRIISTSEGTNTYALLVQSRTCPKDEPFVLGKFTVNVKASLAIGIVYEGFLPLHSYIRGVRLVYKNNSLVYAHSPVIGPSQSTDIITRHEPDAGYVKERMDELLSVFKNVIIVPGSTIRGSQYIGKTGTSFNIYADGIFIGTLNTGALHGTGTFHIMGAMSGGSHSGKAPVSIDRLLHSGYCFNGSITTIGLIKRALVYQHWSFNSEEYEKQRLMRLGKIPPATT